MPISSRGSSPFDPTKYPTSLSRDGVVTPAAAGTYQTLLSVTGKGFITKALVCNNFSPSQTGIKITIDGVVKYEGYAQNGSGNVMVGVCQETDLTASGSNLNARVNIGAGILTGGGFATYPYTGALGLICALVAPIQFNQSLLIEVKNSTTNSQAIAYSINGGMQ